MMVPERHTFSLFLGAKRGRAKVEEEEESPSPLIATVNLLLRRGVLFALILAEARGAQLNPCLTSLPVSYEKNRG